MDIDSDCAVATNTPPIEMADAPLSISGVAREVPPRETSAKGELESGLKSRRQILGQAVGSLEVGLRSGWGYTVHQIIFDVDDHDDRDDMSNLFNLQDDYELDVIAPNSRWQLLGHAVGGSEVGLRDYTVHRIIFDDNDEDDKDDMSKLFNLQDDDELDVIAPTNPPSPPITRTERVKSKRQSRLQRELESSLDGVKWSSGTASPSLPITGTERVQRKRQRRL